MTQGGSADPVQVWMGIARTQTLSVRREPTDGSRLAWKYAGAVTAFVSVAALAAADGGYFPRAWHWSAVAFLWLVSMALRARSRLQLSFLEWATLSALAALFAWTALSTAWSADAWHSLREAERTLVYLAGAAALLLVTRKPSIVRLLGGILGAITAVSAYSLATYLVQATSREPFRDALFQGYRYDPYQRYLLFEPLGYANAAGILAAIGALLALGFAAHVRARGPRVLAAASLALLLPTLFFTSSRAAWLALGCGLGAALALDRRRLALLGTLGVVAPGPALAVWLSSRSHLASEQASLAQVAREAYRLGVAIPVLAVLSAGLAYGLARLAARPGIARRPRRWLLAVLALAAAVVLAGGFSRAGAPAALASLAGDDRADYWQVAWREFEAHPWLGSGAGTFQRSWQEHGPGEDGPRDAHSLYLESLAELGPLGLAALLAALGLPLVAAVKARRHALVPAAFGAYVAYLVHAGVDWDWEMPAVTLSALFCGAALLVAARKAPKPFAPPKP